VDAEGRFLGAIHMKNAFASFVKKRVKMQTRPRYALVDQAALNSKIEEMWTRIEEEPIRFWTEDGVFEWLNVRRTDLADTQPTKLDM
jgi:hypothetical protein